MTHHDTQILDSLLGALQWAGTARQKAEALAGRSDPNCLTSTQLRDVMAHLGYTSTLRTLKPSQLQEADLPVIVMKNKGKLFLIANPSDVVAFKTHINTPYNMIIFQPKETTDEPISQNDNGVKPIIHRFDTLLAQILMASLIIGALALAPTFFNMAIYDHIIASGSAHGLPSMLTGVIVALVLELALRAVRNRRLAYFAARLDHVVNCSVFERLLLLPAALTERASVAAQLARLRDFEAVREFLSSPLASLFCEMPLVLIYLVVIACLAGPVALVPTGLVMAYGVMMLMMRKRLKDTARQAANTGSRCQEFILEMLTKLPAIRLAGLDHVWQDRYQTLSRQATEANMQASIQAQRLEIASYVLMTIGVVATLAAGVHQVIAQDMTTGSLIATMMLIWRVASPLQMACAAMTRVQQVGNSMQQVQRLLTVQPEHEPQEQIWPINLKGRVTFSRVTLRYSNEAEPALLGVSFDVKPGNVVAVRGVNGSGKSSVLKLILGLYQPQGGSIRFDGIDLRQFDPLALRQAIAYVPQALDFLPGTIRDNLLYAAPEATDDDCYQALADACALQEVRQLPHGIDTVIAGESAYPVPFLLQQRLNLARAYVKQATIILCDEASQSLGKDNDDAFRAMIAKNAAKRRFFW